MSAIKRMTLALAMAAMAISNVGAASIGGAKSGRNLDLPSYMCILGEGEEYSISDSLYNSIAASVVFKVNRTELNLQDQFIKQLQDYTLPLANSRRLMLVGIDLRGAASPEGPYNNNVRLSVGRAAALRGFIEARLDSVDTSDMVINTTAEDYPRLLWMMQQAGDPDAEIVANAIAAAGGKEHLIKRLLQNHNKGTLWRRMLKEYYPALRAARVVLVFRQYEAIEGKAERIAMEFEELGDHDFGLLPLIYERRHALSVSTNLLYDAFYMPNYGWAPMPNVALEFFPRNSKYTARAMFTCPYYHRWNDYKFFQIRDYHLEARRYFDPGWLHTGAYLGAYINATKYGIGLGKTKGWQGEGIGGAVKVGYVLPLGSGRWRLDFHLGVGVWYTRFDPYVYGNPITGDDTGDYYYDWVGKASDFHKRNHQMVWFGPSEIGITLSYDLLYYRIIKPGVSALRKEVIGL